MLRRDGGVLRDPELPLLPALGAAEADGGAAEAVPLCVLLGLGPLVLAPCWAWLEKKLKTFCSRPLPAGPAPAPLLSSLPLRELEEVLGPLEPACGAPGPECGSGWGTSWYLQHKRRWPGCHYAQGVCYVPAHGTGSAILEPRHDAGLVKRMFTGKGNDDEFIRVFALEGELVLANRTVLLEQRR